MSGQRRAASRLLTLAAVALDHVHSFDLEESWFYYDAQFRPRTLSGLFDLPGRFELKLSTGGVRATIVVIKGTAYVRGNVLYWAQSVSAPNVVSVLSSRWVRLPATTVPGLSFYAALADPQTLGRCVLQSLAGAVAGPQRTELNGSQQAWNLQFGEGQTGARNGSVMLSATGPPLPIVITETEPAEATGAVDPGCGQTAPSVPVREAMIFFRRYNAAINIGAPRSWISPSGIRAAALAPAQKHASLNRSTRAAQERALLGTWAATGTIIASHNFENEPPGLTFQRVWLIRRYCLAGRCQLYVTRTTRAGSLSTPLIWARDHWTADFVMTVSCTTGADSTDHLHWTLTVQPDAIQVLEHERATGTCPSTSVTRWVAHRALSPPGTGGTT